MHKLSTKQGLLCYSVAQLYVYAMHYFQCVLQLEGGVGGRYVHVPFFWHNFNGPFYSNNGRYGTLPLMVYIYLPFLAYLCTQ